MARRVIRAVTDLDNRQGQRWTMDRLQWIERRVYRIEWPDGEPTGSGLFVNRKSASDYAREHGWPLSVGQEGE